MKICRKCGAKYPDTETVCKNDGSPLYPVPDFLTKRASPSKSEDPLIGRQIEKYRVVRKIGEGGMGFVYEAEHVHIGKKVALKVLREDYTKKEDVIARFQQEARSASIIGHPNIIDVTDFGYTPDGRVFFVMEYLEGDDLATMLESEKVLPYKRVIGIMTQVCDALYAAHQKSIIHRDMKPENIFLINPGTEKETVKILDFGIAKMSVLDQEGRKLTKTGVVFGTPEYMSPEQAAGKSIDHRVDIYALGIILYEMLTGKVPFTGETFMAVLSKHIFEPVPPVEKVNPSAEVPEPLKKIVYKCLEKEPEDRFSDACELKEALEEIEDFDQSVSVKVEVLEKHKVSSTPGHVLEVIGDGGISSAAVSSKKGKFFKIALPIILIILSGLVGGLYYKYSASAVSDVGDGPSGSSMKLSGGSQDANFSSAPTGKLTGSTGTISGANPSVPEVADDEAGEGQANKPELISLSISTIPGGAVVEVEGQGQKCPTTPCQFEVEKGKEIGLVIKKGRSVIRRSIIPEENPTILSYKISEKPMKKVVKLKGKKYSIKKVKSVQEGELKTPVIWKKDREVPGIAPE